MSEQIGNKKSLPYYDSIALYLESMRSTVLLTAEQEVALAQDMEAGATAEAILLGRQQARDEAQGITYKSLADRLAELDPDMKASARVKREQAITSDVEYTTGLMERFPEAEVSDRDLGILAMRGAEARQHFIASNLPLAFTMAKRSGHRVPLLDKVQWANLGLIRAVDKFDYRRGFKFSTHATWWIRQAIGEEAMNTCRTIRLPKHVEVNLGTLRGAQADLTRKLRREPTPQELAAEMTTLTGDETTPKKVKQLLSWGKTLASLDLPIGDEEDSVLGDILYVEGEDFEQEMIDCALLQDILNVAEKVIPDEPTRDAYLQWVGGDPKAASKLAERRGVTAKSMYDKFRRYNKAIQKALHSDEPQK